MTLPFDKIEVEENGAWHALTLEQWMTGEIAKRVDQIVKKKARFTNEGKPVPTSLALAAINALRAQKPK